MESALGLRGSKAPYSPLAGSAEFRAQHAESSLQQIKRSEWWLWFFTLLVTGLSATGLALTANPSYFLHGEHFYEIRSDQARWAILCLLLLFNGWQVYRQWTFRRMRKELAQDDAGREVPTVQTFELSGIDPVTGLLTRVFIQQELGKEIARAKRLRSSLSLATIHVDGLVETTNRYGMSATNAALKDLGRRLKKACRGSDFAVRLSSDDFLLVLPECGLSEVATVLKRIGILETAWSGKKLNLTYSTGTADYRPGDLPSDLIKRATEVLHLYENAAK